MAQTKFVSGEHFFENKRSFQIYNKKITEMKTNFTRAFINHDNAWRFMENNKVLTLLAKNVTRLDEFFLFHYCDTVGQLIVDKEKNEWG